jgi:hypothetical protein
VELVLQKDRNSKPRPGSVLGAAAGTDSARVRAWSWCAVSATEQKPEIVPFLIGDRRHPRATGYAIPGRTHLGNERAQKLPVGKNRPLESQKIARAEKFWHSSQDQSRLRLAPGIVRTVTQKSWSAGADQ